MVKHNVPCLIGGAANTGVGRCSIDLKNVRKDILVPKGTRIAESDWATIFDKLSDMAHEEARTKRAYPIGIFLGAEPANVDPVTSEWGYGMTEKIREGKVGRTYQLKGLELNQRMRKFDDREDAYDRFFVVDGNRLVGTLGTNALDGTRYIKGFALDRLNVAPYQEAMNSDPARWEYTVVHASSDEWDNIAVIQATDGTIADIEGLLDIVLTEKRKTPHVAGTYHILADADGENLAELYPTELASVSLWRGIDADTGAALTISAVTVNAIGEFVLTFTSDAAFTAAVKIRISLVAPSLLAAADVEWYESGYVVVPK